MHPFLFSSLSCFPFFSVGVVAMSRLAALKMVCLTTVCVLFFFVDYKRSSLWSVSLCAYLCVCL